MGTLERTDQILKGNMEDTGTASKTQKEKLSILSFAQAYNLVVANTYFQKNDEHLITYKSGDRCSTVDYIITRRDLEKLKNIKDCKVIPGECTITQHRILVRKPQIRWWKMKKQEEKICIHTSSDA